ncbi:hypothetical protein LSH36_127g18067 [Paralvinella palmiformis]|uniref:Uncharacterized protein n=1 Tax=Paralvinella palmiformis TaxID=53620 RepID=A0AAD9JY19_9ANNE|nr:hypothetical protein LSH36_127g18067 [Paralvinella palmiformis]
MTLFTFTRCNRLDNLYLHVPVYKPSVNKSKVHFHNCLSYDGAFVVEFSSSQSLFSPDSIMFRTKAKDISFSGCIATLTFFTRSVCSLDHKLSPSKEYGTGLRGNTEQVAAYSQISRPHQGQQRRVSKVT